MGNSQQRCMFESPVKQIPSSPILETMFLHSPESARRPAANYLQCFARTHQRAWPVSLCQRRIGWKLQIFPIPLSFSALVRGDSFRIYGKVLRFTQLDSSRQPTVKIWWSYLAPFLTDPPAWRADGRTDRIAMAKTRYSNSCCCM